MIHFFQGLRGKLILTYTLVTVLALLALEVLLMLSIVALSSLMRIDQRDYMNDVVTTLYPAASEYLQPGKENQAGLQAWLDEVYQSGKASLDPQDGFDSPVAKIVKVRSMYVLSPDSTVLAQSPLGANNLVGRTYTPPDTDESQEVLTRALAGSRDALRLYTVDRYGKYLMMVPVWQESYESDVVGVIVLTIEPPPPYLLSIGPTLLLGVLVTGVILLMGVAPFGAVFGMVMSRGLTRRLRALSEAVDDWSEGDFRPLPTDRSKDEISTLGKRMWNMAERIQGLLQTQQQLAALEERNRLARELHDTVKQQNFATLMQVRAARNLIASSPEEAGQRLAEAETMIKTSQQELNLIIAELRPAALENLGLSGALEKYLNTWSQHALIPASFQVQGDQRLPLEREQTLYRVAQEALSNVARHSRASEVKTKLAFEPNGVSLIICDNGVGFTPQERAAAGFGLQSMSDRLAHMGGRLVIDSTPGCGTTLTAFLPNEQPPNHENESKPQ